MLEENKTVKKARGARVEARVSNEQKALFKHAAALAGRSLSEFMIDSMQQAAGQIVQDQSIIRLSRDEQIAFVELLLDPPEPGARLQQAVAEYRTKTER